VIQRRLGPLFLLNQLNPKGRFARTSAQGNTRVRSDATVTHTQTHTP
jgi:hypothetical protein